MAERETGAVGGAIKGFAVAGPVGAIIGGVMGLGAGHDAARARIYANRAKKTERAMGYMEAAVQRRDMLRNARMARAESLAASSAGGEGGLQSSGARGALSSISSQTNFNLRYFDARIADFIKMQQWIDKAGKRAASSANMQAFMSMAASAVNAYGTMGGTPSGGSTASSSTLGGTTNVTFGSPSAGYGSYSSGGWGMTGNTGATMASYGRVGG